MTAQTIAEARAFWLGIATEGGWADTHPDLTVWMDSHGHVTDSVMTRDGSDTTTIVTAHTTTRSSTPEELRAIRRADFDNR